MTTIEVIVYSTMLYLFIGSLIVGWKMRMDAKAKFEATAEEEQDNEDIDDDSFLVITKEGKLKAEWKHPA